MIEVLKQLVDALENHSAIKHPQQIHYRDAAIEAGKQAIAELESQEPVATVTSETGADITMSWWHEPALPMGTKLFTHPPQRTWVGLTDEEIDVIDEATWDEDHKSWGIHDFAKAIEAKLKENNT